MVVDRYGWNGDLRIEERVVTELEFWRKNLRDLNGWEMRMSDKVVYCRDGQVEMFSDASDLQVGGARFYGEKVAWDTVFKAVLAEEERKKSSTFRELRGIEEGILANGRKLQGKVVRWGCDNWAAGKIVKLGSMKKDCHAVALRIEELCRKWKIKLETFWISRDSKQIEYCDWVSKEVDTSDYWIADEDFWGLEREFGPFEADYFASDRLL